jgi:hypothetical protein
MPTEGPNQSHSDGTAQKLVGPAFNQGAGSGSYGIVSAGKGFTDYCGFWTFDLAMPVGSIIDGLKIQLWQPSGSSGTTFPVEIGWLEQDGIWDVSGMLGYAGSSTNLPFVEWNSGIGLRPDRWVGGAPGTVATITSTTGGLYDQSYGENLAARNTVTGLIAQLQSFWDDNAGPTGGRVMFHAHKAYVSTVNHNVGAYMKESGLVAYRPTITVEYSEPSTGGTASARSSLGSHVSSRISAQGSVSSRVEDQARVGSRIIDQALVSSRVELFSAVAARREVVD